MAYGHELDEAAEALRERILETQKEIAALRHPRATDDRLMAAVGELDAIVKATEDATERILAAVESVEGTLSKLESAADSEILKGAGEALTSIYEACTFQDITGQRITKVVRTLDFIEERVQAMMAIWGEHSFADLPLPDEVDPDEEAGLLNGPGQDGGGISQDDIDSLFD